jgi:cold shock CspA family protein
MNALVFELLEEPVVVAEPAPMAPNNAKWPSAAKGFGFSAPEGRGNDVLVQSAPTALQEPDALVPDREMHRLDFRDDYFCFGEGSATVASDAIDPSFSSQSAPMGGSNAAWVIPVIGMAAIAYAISNDDDGGYEPGAADAGVSSSGIALFGDARLGMQDDFL